MTSIPGDDYGTTLTDRPTGWPGAISRVSWGAVFAGLVIATALQVVFTVLGAAIGLTALDGSDSGRAFGIGTAIWALLVPLVTLFVGGATAGRLAAVRDRSSGFIHGALVWGLSLLLAVWLLGTGASRVLGGTLNLAGNVAGSAVSTASDVAASGNVDVEGARDRLESEAAERGISQQDVQNQAAQARERAGEIADTAQAAAAGGAWLALLALGLSLGAAALGALRTVPRHARGHTTAV
jgi:hypothetical protein